jgi:hypothetical protein
MKETLCSHRQNRASKDGHPANSGSFAAQLAIVLLPGTTVTVGPPRPKGKGPNPNPAWSLTAALTGESVRSLRPATSLTVHELNTSLRPKNSAEPHPPRVLLCFWASASTRTGWRNPSRHGLRARFRAASCCLCGARFCWRGCGELATVAQLGPCDPDLYATAAEAH